MQALRSLHQLRKSRSSDRLELECEIYAVRGPEGIPNSLSAAFKITDVEVSGENCMAIQIVRKAITVYGFVQGVGFRYRTVHAANAVGCTGWVRNNSDGSVSMEIQGTEEQIDKVFLMIEKNSYISIDRMDVKKIEVLDGERDFKA